MAPEDKPIHRTDQVSPKTAFWKWTIIGCLAATTLVIAQTNAVGGTAGLLQVGEVSPLHQILEEQLGDVPEDAPHNGHDTQTFYAIALDLAGDRVPELFDNAAYRYRRILYPASASLFGLLDGHALLTSMIVITIASAGLATGLTAAIARRRGLSDWVALAVLLNPGVWLAVRLITADMLALFLMLLGLHWFLMGRKWAPLAFALSGLAKEVYLVTPGALALASPRRRWSLIVVPVSVLVSWMAWLTLTMGDALTSGGNLDLPFVGIIEAARVWNAVDGTDLFYLLFALVSVAVGLVYSSFTKSWLRWPIMAWSALGLLSSGFVWNFGNNAARAFAPIAVLIALSVRSRRPDEVSEPGEIVLGLAE